MSDSQNKDLTGILDLITPGSASSEGATPDLGQIPGLDAAQSSGDDALSLEPLQPLELGAQDPHAHASGDAPGFAFETQMPEPEKVEEFESLEQFAENNPAQEIAAAPAPEFESQDFASPSVDSSPSPGFAAEVAEAVLDLGPPEPAVAEPTPEPKPKPDAIGEIKAYSERVVTAKPAVQAAFPFSLQIEGELTAQEKEKLLDLLARENMGIREVDLEPQFAAGRLLIPRISEYAGVLLVQALRGTTAKMRLGPSDRIFSTADTHSSSDDPVYLSGESHGGTEVQHTESSHPAESLIVTPQNQLPGLARYTVIGVITASANLDCDAVEADRSPEYQEMVENLEREIRYKAYRKGATAVIGFTLTLTQLASKTQYRLQALGSAIKSS